jgi:hypothetical protein
MRLRCGVARGDVIAIGGGKDFIGPCINAASRLQKISQMSFAFPKKGFNPDECFGPSWSSRFVLMKVFLRGIAKGELVFVPKKEYEALTEDEKMFFEKP